VTEEELVEIERTAGEDDVPVAFLTAAIDQLILDIRALDIVCTSLKRKFDSSEKVLAESRWEYEALRNSYEYLSHEDKLKDAKIASLENMIRGQRDTIALYDKLNHQLTERV
jgi:hypothetical protein